eukprot:367436_1
MDPNELNKNELAKMFGLMHTPKYKKFLKKCKAHKLSNMPSELKMLLLDNKKKKQQKSELIKLMAEKNNENVNENSNNCEKFENEDVPKWFDDAFKHRKDNNNNKNNKNEKDNNNEMDNEVENWLESEEEINENDKDYNMLELDDDDIEDLTGNYYDNNGIRKGILLCKYIEMLMEWMKFEEKKKKDR